jgi:Leucine-rich repeat (LRR) protein
MGTRKCGLSGLAVFALIITSFALAFILSTQARAITFEQWATGQGWSAGDVMPHWVYANSAAIDSLTGISRYDWITWPTEYLDLYQNQIARVPPGTFTGLSELSWLDMRNNQIADIESGSFTGLTNLRTLVLATNQISSIEPNDFAGMDKLATLSLFDNCISSIEPGDFAGLGSLRSLGLGGNPIASIESGVFAGLSNLTFLSLSHAAVTRFQAGDFAGLDKLTDLYLSGNQIANLEPSGFLGLKNLKLLDLDHNKITSLEPSDFTGLGNLGRLFLESNDISKIESGTFANVALGELDLSDNVTLTELNLEGANLSNFWDIDLKNDTSISRVSLKNATLGQMALEGLVYGDALYNPYSWEEPRVGIGDLPAVTELDLSYVDFSAISYLDPLYEMDNVTDLWLVGVKNMHGFMLDELLTNLAGIRDSQGGGTVYMTQADYDAFNVRGRLTWWESRYGHHIQIVPEPSTTILLATLLAALALYRLRRR